MYQLNDMNVSRIAVGRFARDKDQDGVLMVLDGFAWRARLALVACCQTIQDSPPDRDPDYGGRNYINAASEKPSGRGRRKG